MNIRLSKGSAAQEQIAGRRLGKVRFQMKTPEGIEPLNGIVKGQVLRASEPEHRSPSFVSNPVS